jgi:hypothetical protein
MCGCLTLASGVAMFYTLASGVPIWTAYEVLLLWA